MSALIRVLQKCAPPWLHIRLGAVNHTYTKLKIVAPEAAKWPEALHLHEERYHGTGFEGNECQRLLENIDLLEDILSQFGKIEVGAPFVRVFRSFYKVNHIFSSSSVDVNALERQVKDFRQAWKESGMNLIPKVHIVFDHIVEFVKLRDAKNLYTVSEQSHESLHAEYAKTWKKYCVKETSNPNYKTNFLRSVLDFNGSHGF